MAGFKPLDSFKFDVGGGSNIKSIQSGNMYDIFRYADKKVTIQEVDIDKSIIIFYGANDRQYHGLSLGACFLDSTTIEFRCGSNNTVDYSRISWTVVEFKKVKSLQRGVFSLSTPNIVQPWSFNETVPITKVELNKSIFLLSGVYGSVSSSTTPQPIAIAYLNLDGTGVQFIGNCKQYTSNINFVWQVVEFD